MKNYEWILFDADETLFHFDAFKGLQAMFSRFGVTFTEQDFLDYQMVNKPLWVEYQNGKISAETLQQQRFVIWGNKLNVAPRDLNTAFLDAMADLCVPIDGAVQLLSTLSSKMKFGIITNGFTQLQQIRLQRTGLQSHFEFLVISEEVGIAKPHPGIFDHALELMGNPPREHVLMVGDTLESDILGGINAGIDTCWLNTSNKSSVEGIIPHYTVSSLNELQHLLLETSTIQS